MFKDSIVIVALLLSSACMAQSDTFKSLDSTMLSLYRSCQFEQIISLGDSLESNTLVTDNSVLAILSYWRGKIYSEQIQPEQAKIHFKISGEICAQLGPNFNNELARTKLEQASQIADEGDIQEAKKQIQEALSLPNLSQKTLGNLYRYAGLFYADIGSLNKADSFISIVENLILKTDSTSQTACYIYLLRAVYFNYKRNFGEAHKLALKTFDIIQEKEAPSLHLKNKALSVLAGTYNSIRDHEQSRKIYDQVLNADLCHSASFLSIRALANLNLGIGYNLERKYHFAIQHFKEALSHFDELYANDNLYTLTAKAKLAGSYSFMGDLLNTKKIALPAIEMAQKIGLENSIQVHDMFIALGNATQDDSLRLAYTIQAYHIADSIFGERHFATIATAIALSHSYAKVGDYQNTIRYNKIVNNLMASHGNHPSIAGIYADLSEGYVNNNHLDSANIFVDSIFENIHNTIQIDKLVYQAAHSVPRMFAQMARINKVRWEQTDDLKYLKTAYENYGYALGAIKFILPITPFPNEKYELLDMLHMHYTAAIECGLILSEKDTFSVEQIYNLVRSHKNIVLESQTNQIAQNPDAIPDSLKLTLTRLNTQILLIQREIESSESSVHLPELRRKMIALKNAFGRLSNRSNAIDKSIVIEQIPIKPIQASLPDNTLILEYFFSQNDLYVFTIAKNRLSYHKLISKNSIETLIQDQRQAMTDFSYGDHKRLQRMDVREIGNSLYHILLDPFIVKIESELIKHLIIIPDGALFYLPFESMTNANGKYLVEEDYTISYGFDAEIFSRNKSMKQSYQMSYFAPIYDRKSISSSDTIRSKELASLVRSGYVDLPIDPVELDVLKKLCRADIYLGRAATKDNFLNEVKGGVVHFSMHAIQMERNPMHSHLIFQRIENVAKDEEKLFLGEIYSLPNAYNLAFIGACQTGFGPITKGEGVVSFARAFQAAGTSTTITGLWNLPHRSTSEITTAFYKNLSMGDSKATALKKAKLKYFNDQLEPELRHPYFWAGLVLNGDHNPIQFNQSKISAAYIFALIGMTLIGILIYTFPRKLPIE